jgi:hypothetical protein
MTIDDRTFKRIPRYTGRDAEANTEMNRFGNAGFAGRWSTCDLTQVFEHVHDRWDEIAEGAKSRIPAPFSRS